MAQLEIVHDGMGWPVGAVIDSAALARDGADHLAIGAVRRTARPITHPYEPPVRTEPVGPTDASALEPLRAQVRDLQAKLAGAEDRAQRAGIEVEKLQAENEGLWKQLEELSAQADTRAAVERQKALDANVPTPAAPQ